MRILDKVFAGRTDTFAMEMVVLEEQDGAEPRADDAWGAVAIWVAGRSITAHVDRDGAKWEHIHWYLGSLLEWFASSWPELFHNQKTPFIPRAPQLVREFEGPVDPPITLSPAQAEAWSQARHQFWRTHFIVAARDGGPMPNLAFIRRGDQMQVSWSGRDVVGTRLAYEVPLGARDLPAAEVAETVRIALKGASEALTRIYPACTRWRTLARAAEGVARKDEGTTIDFLLRLLGARHPDAWKQALAGLEPPARRTVERASQAAWLSPGCLGCPEPALMFGTLRPTLSSRDHVVLLREWAGAQQPGRPPTALDTLVAPPPNLWHAPYRQGQDAAEYVRDALKWGSSPVLDIEIRLQDLGVALKEIELDDHAVPAVALVSGSTAPTILLNRNSKVIQREWGRRMALAHELAHLVLDRDKARRLGLADGPWAPVAVEQRARAFAAWLLMPEAGVRDALRECHDPGGAEAVRRMGEVFGVSWRAAAMHLVSLGVLADNVEAEFVLEDAAFESEGV